MLFSLAACNLANHLKLLTQSNSVSDAFGGHDAAYKRLCAPKTVVWNVFVRSFVRVKEAVAVAELEECTSRKKESQQGASLARGNKLLGKWCNVSVSADYPIG